MTRKEFLKRFGATAATLGIVQTGEGKMKPDEQVAHDRHAASKPPTPAGLLDSEPMLQVPGTNSAGVTFAVKAMSMGFVELADNPEMKAPTRFEVDGMPMAKIDSRILQVRMTGLKSATRYWYRIGAAALTHPIGYWTKLTPIAWGKVHSFVTCGEKAESRFAFICDTHGQWESFDKIAAKLKQLAPPVTVWGGDVPNSKIDDEEYAVELFLKPKISLPDWASDTPILYLDGNHDYRGDWIAANPLRIMMGRLESERSPGHRQLSRNFALRQGKIAMIGMETGEDKPDFHPANGGMTRFKRYRTMQTEWLRAQFKRPEIATAPFVIAFCHIPLFDPNPEANPGEILENYADYQGQCAAEWGPVLKENGVQLVVCGHKHRLRLDSPTPDRPWAQIVGGGPKCPTVIEGRVECGRLTVVAHDLLRNQVSLSQEFSARQ